jgi:hypothetical protein
MTLCARVEPCLPSTTALRLLAAVDGDLIDDWRYSAECELRTQGRSAGLGDDSRYLQISAPVQPGNSGGPLLDASGHLVGIVTGKLNAGNENIFGKQKHCLPNRALAATIVPSRCRRDRAAIYRPG